MSSHQAEGHNIQGRLYTGSPGANFTPTTVDSEEHIQELANHLDSPGCLKGKKHVSVCSSFSVFGIEMQEFRDGMVLDPTNVFSNSFKPPFLGIFYYSVIHTSSESLASMTSAETMDPIEEGKV
jgi:hypothetical protein